jgi:hypothetical protein
MAGYRAALLGAVFGIGLGALLAHPTYAHCDGFDGPVVKAAQEALAKNDVNIVLIWVQGSDEVAIRRAFERTMDVRKLSPQAQELADTYFFETVVRTHRAGEGAAFTGLKPAGRDLGPAIPAADQALKSGDVTPLTDLLVDSMRSGLADRFKLAMAARKFATQDIDAGRDYVEKYVTLIHYVEGMYEAATRPVEGHYPEGEADMQSQVHPARGLTRPMKLTVAFGARSLSAIRSAPGGDIVGGGQ